MQDIIPAKKLQKLSNTNGNTLQHHTEITHRKLHNDIYTQFRNIVCDMIEQLKQKISEDPNAIIRKQIINDDIHKIVYEELRFMYIFEFDRWWDNFSLHQPLASLIHELNRKNYIFNITLDQKTLYFNLTLQIK